MPSILVVDDGDDTRSNMADLVGHLGYVVDAAEGIGELQGGCDIGANPRHLQPPRLKHRESPGDEPARRERGMLVLTRRVGEEIVIAGTIRVMVVMVKGQAIRLGITAPSSVPVVRRELLAECSHGERPPTSGRPCRSQESGATSSRSAS